MLLIRVNGISVADRGYNEVRDAIRNAAWPIEMQFGPPKDFSPSSSPSVTEFKEAHEKSQRREKQQQKKLKQPEKLQRKSQQLFEQIDSNGDGVIDRKVTAARWEHCLTDLFDRSLQRLELLYPLRTLTH